MNQTTINDLLVKKTQGVAFTSTAFSTAGENAGSALPIVFNTNVQGQSVPGTAPILADFIEIPDASGSFGIDVSGGRIYNTDVNYIKYYEKVLLEEKVFNGAYWYPGTILTDFRNTNKLVNAIPGNTDPGGSYAIKVYAENGTDSFTSDSPSRPWLFDNASGYLTFFNGWNKSSLGLPRISYYRYEGTMGMSSGSGSGFTTEVTERYHQWSNRLDVSNNNWNSIAYGSDRLVAVGGKKHFNAVKVIRTSDNNLGNADNKVIIDQIQIWINNQNIAPSGKATTFGYLNDSNGIWRPSNVLDGIVGNTTTDQRSYHNPSYAGHDHYYLGAWVKVDISDRNINDLQSVLVHAYFEDNEVAKARIPGVSIQLLYDDEVIYSHEISTPGGFFRLDGPDMKNATNLLIDNAYSQYKISNFSRQICSDIKVLSPISSKVTSETFNRVRLFKPSIYDGLDASEPDPINNRFGIDELQLWIDGSNVLLNSTITTNREPYTGNYPVTNIINGLLMYNGWDPVFEYRKFLTKTRGASLGVTVDLLLDKSYSTDQINSLVLSSDQFSIKRSKDVNIQLIKDAPQDVLFNEIRLRRTSNGRSSRKERLRIREVQLWVKKNNEFINILSNTYSSPPTWVSRTVHSSYYVYYCGNNMFDEGTAIYESQNSGDNNSDDIPLKPEFVFAYGLEPTYIYDTAALIVYAAIGSITANNKGISIDFMYNNNIVYTYETYTEDPCIRFNGPQINNVPRSMFSINDSTEKIRNNGEGIGTSIKKLPNINTQITSGTFNKVRVVRTTGAIQAGYRDPGAASDFLYANGRFHILQIQLWVGGINVASSSNGGVVKSSGTWDNAAYDEGHVNDGLLTTSWHPRDYETGSNTTESGDKGVYKFIEIDVGNKNINDIQSVVVFPSCGNHREIARLAGISMQLIKSVDPSTSSVKFNKIRLVRYSDSTLGDGSTMNIREAQIWINNVNIGTSATATATSQYSTYTISKINNGNGESGNFWHTTHHTGSGNNPSHGGHNGYVNLTLSQSYNISDLQSIVIYNRINNVAAHRIDGIALEIIDENNNVIYSSTITTSNPVYRFDGPAISTYTGSFSTEFSNTSIVSTDDHTDSNMNSGAYSNPYPISYKTIDLIDEILYTSEIRNLGKVYRADGNDFSSLTVTNKTLNYTTSKVMVDLEDTDISNNLTFNKLKIVRIGHRSGSTSSSSGQLSVNELQLWAKKQNTIYNIASNSYSVSPTWSSNSNNANNEYADPSALGDDNILNISNSRLMNDWNFKYINASGTQVLASSGRWASIANENFDANDPHWVSVEVEETKISEIVSILAYPHATYSNNSHDLHNTAIQLIKTTGGNDEILYQFDVLSDKTQYNLIRDYVRIDGPAFNSVHSNMLSDVDTSTGIKDLDISMNVTDIYGGKIIYNERIDDIAPTYHIEGPNFAAINNSEKSLMPSHSKIVTDITDSTYTNDLSFNSLRIIRTNGKDYVTVRFSQIQLWIDGKNVALSKNGTIASDNSNKPDTIANDPRKSDNLIDNIFDNIWHTYDANLYASMYALLRLNNSYLLNSIQSIVLYGRYQNGSFSQTDRSVGISVQLINTIPAASSNVYFNKVRLLELSDTNDEMCIREIQIFVNNVNVANKFTATSSSYHDSENTDDWAPTLANNNRILGVDTDEGNEISFCPEEGKGQWLLLTGYSININDLNSIVIYNHPTFSNLILGVDFELLFDENVVYSKSINTDKNVYRFDGPAINSVPRNFLSANDHIYKIKHANGNIFENDVNMLPNTNTQTTNGLFNKVRIKRTSLYKPVIGKDGSGGYSNIAQLQIWVGNTNIANTSATAVALQNKDHSYKIIDNDLTTTWSNATEGTGYYIDVHLTNEYNISQLQSIVLYHMIYDSSSPHVNHNLAYRTVGLSIQLIGSSGIIYSYEIQVPALIHRLDGPASMATIGKSLAPSTQSLITNGDDTTFINGLVFDRIILNPKDENVHFAGTNTNKHRCSQLQVWVKNGNTYTNIAPSASSIQMVSGSTATNGSYLTDNLFDNYFEFTSLSTMAQYTEALVIELGTTVNFSDLASIVYYSDDTDEGMYSVGMEVVLANGGNNVSDAVYTYEISQRSRYYRIDGPGITSYSNFSSIDSSLNIIDTLTDVSINTIDYVHDIVWSNETTNAQDVYRFDGPSFNTLADASFSDTPSLTHVYRNSMLVPPLTNKPSVMYSDDDGLNWQYNESTNNSHTFNKVIHANDTFVAIGKKQIASSIDGSANWIDASFVDPITNEEFTGISYGNLPSGADAFVTVTKNNVPKYSNDGLTNWTNFSPIRSIGKVFNRVRLIRTADGTTNNTLVINELQIWMNNENIALKGTANARNNLTGWLPKYINNSQVNSFTPFDWTVSSNRDNQGAYHDSAPHVIGNWVQITLDNQYNIDDLQCIVIYPWDSELSVKRTNGVSVQVMYNDEILYTEEIPVNRLSYRVEGPAFNTIPYSMFTVENSPYKIKHETYGISTGVVALPKLNTQVTSGTFNKLRLIRLNKYDTNKNPFQVSELQIWKNNTNIALNWTPENIGTNYYSVYSPSRVINGDVDSIGYYSGATSDNYTFENGHLIIHNNVDENVSDLQSIVLYASTEGYKNLETNNVGRYEGISVDVISNKLAASSGAIFNKIRLTRTKDQSLDTTIGDPQRLVIGCLQIWKKDGDKIIDLTQNGTIRILNTGNSGSEDTVIDGYINSIKNTILNNNTEVLGISGQGSFVTVEFDDTPISDLASVIFCQWIRARGDTDGLGNPDSNDIKYCARGVGITLEILYNDRIVYSIENTEPRSIYCYEGPAINNISSDLLTNNLSSHKILHSSQTFNPNIYSLPSISTQITTGTFRKIHLKKFRDDDYWEDIRLDDMQLWMNNENYIKKPNFYIFDTWDVTSSSSSSGGTANDNTIGWLDSDNGGVPKFRWYKGLEKLSTTAKIFVEYTMADITFRKNGAINNDPECPNTPKIKFYKTTGVEITSSEDPADTTSVSNTTLDKSTIHAREGKTHIRTFVLSGDHLTNTEFDVRFESGHGTNAIGLIQVKIWTEDSFVTNSNTSAKNLVFNNNYHRWELDLEQDYQISDIQNILYYSLDLPIVYGDYVGSSFGGYFQSYGTQKGTIIELLDANDNVVYNNQIEVSAPFYSIQGNNYNNISNSLKTIVPSETKVLVNGTNMDYNITFQKVKLIRTSEYGYTDPQDRKMEFRELQVWIGGANVAYQKTTTVSTELQGTYVGSNLVNGDISTNIGNSVWASNANGIGEYAIVDLATNYSINSIQSIVLYKSSLAQRNIGVSLQLLDSADNVIFTHEINTTQPVYRFDGPDISSYSSFVTIESSSNIFDVENGAISEFFTDTSDWNHVSFDIINNVDHILYTHEITKEHHAYRIDGPDFDNLLDSKKVLDACANAVFIDHHETNNSIIFNRIRIKRTNNSDYSDNIFGVKEIQLWAKENNFIKNILQNKGVYVSDGIYRWHNIDWRARNWINNSASGSVDSGYGKIERTGGHGHLEELTTRPHATISGFGDVQLKDLASLLWYSMINGYTARQIGVSIQLIYFDGAKETIIHNFEKQKIAKNDVALYVTRFDGPLISDVPKDLFGFIPNDDENSTQLDVIKIPDDYGFPSTVGSSSTADEGDLIVAGNVFYNLTPIDKYVQHNSYPAELLSSSYNHHWKDIAYGQYNKETFHSFNKIKLIRTAGNISDDSNNKPISIRDLQVWDGSGGILANVNPINTNVTFNKLKIYKNVEGWVTAREIQIWVYENGNLTNVALNKVVDYNEYYVHNSENRLPSFLNNGSVIDSHATGGDGAWVANVTSANKSESWALINLLDNIKLENLASVIYYSDAWDSDSTPAGTIIELLDDSTPIFSYEIQSNEKENGNGAGHDTTYQIRYPVYRFNGPAINKVPYNKFTFDLSANGITKGVPIYDSESTGLNVFNKIRVIRTRNSTRFDQNSETNSNRINISELQLWMDNSGNVKNVLKDIQGLATSGYFDDSYPIVNATNGDTTYGWGWMGANLNDDVSSIGDNITFTVEEQDFSKIASIVYYFNAETGTGDKDRLLFIDGTSVQLLYNNTLIYTYEIQYSSYKIGSNNTNWGEKSFRFDGPAINTVAQFSEQNSTELIKGMPRIYNQIKGREHEFTLTTSVDLINLASVVLYNDTSTPLVGTIIQLMNDDAVVYSQEILYEKNFYRIDGPEISSHTLIDLSLNNYINNGIPNMLNSGYNLKSIVTPNLIEGDNMFVAVGGNGYSMRCAKENGSGDLTWSLNIDRDQQSFNSVVYGKSAKIFVAVGPNGVKWSTDGAIWTSYGVTGVPIANWKSVKYGSDDKFYAVADVGETNRFMYSLDGKTWISSYINNEINDITLGETNLVGVSSCGYKRVLVNDVVQNSMSMGNGAVAPYDDSIAIGRNVRTLSKNSLIIGNCIMVNSKDEDEFDTEFRPCYHGNTQDAGTNNKPNMTSFGDMQNATASSNQNITYIRSMAYGNGKFFGQGHSGDNDGYLVYSFDGIVWNSYKFQTNYRQARNIKFINNKFVTCVITSTFAHGRLIWTLNENANVEGEAGIGKWSNLAAPSIGAESITTDYGTFTSITYGFDKYWMLCLSKTKFRIYYCTSLNDDSTVSGLGYIDLTDVEPLHDTSSSHYKDDIVYGNNRIVVAGRKGLISYSTNGGLTSRDWNSYFLNVQGDPRGIDYIEHSKLFIISLCGSSTSDFNCSILYTKTPENPNSWVNVVMGYQLEVWNVLYSKKFEKYVCNGSLFYSNGSWSREAHTAKSVSYHSAFVGYSDDLHNWKLNRIGDTIQDSLYPTSANYDYHDSFFDQRSYAMTLDDEGYVYVGTHHNNSTFAAVHTNKKITLNTRLDYVRWPASTIMGYWNYNSSNTDDYSFGIAYGNGYFVVATSTGMIWYAKENDDLSSRTSWQLGYGGKFAYNSREIHIIDDIKYANNTFVAMMRDNIQSNSAGYDYKILTCVNNNLQKWHESVMPVDLTNNGSQGWIKYLNGKWIVNKGEHHLCYSKDGLDWNVCFANHHRETANTTTEIYDIQHVHGRFVITTNWTNNTPIRYSNKAYDISEVTDWYPDNGSVWSNSVTVSNTTTDVNYYGDQLLFANNILVWGTGTNGIYTTACCDGIIRNGGFTWHFNGKFPHGQLCHDLSYFNNYFIIVGNSSVINFSQDGKNWNYIILHSSVYGGGNYHRIAHGKHYSIITGSSSISISGTNERSIQIGNESSRYGISIGNNAQALYRGSVAIGHNARCYQPGEINLHGNVLLSKLDERSCGQLRFGPNDAFGGSGDRCYMQYVSSSSLYGEATNLVILNQNDSDDAVYVNTQSFKYNGNTVSTSDNRVKHNEIFITNALENIRQLKGYHYIKTSEMYDENHHFELDSSNNPIDVNGNRVPHFLEDGFIAQDVQKINHLSKSVKETAFSDEPLFLNYNNIFVNTTVALQELDKLHTITKEELNNEKEKTQNLENENKLLKTQINDILIKFSLLEERMNKLELVSSPEPMPEPEP